MKLPEYNQKTSMIPEAPPGVDINPTSYGQVARQAGEIGDKLASLSQALLDKRQEATDQDFGYTRSQEDRRALNDYKVEQYDAYQKSGDFTGYTKAIQDKANDLFQQAQSDAPSEGAKALYLHHATEYFTSSYIDAQKQEGIENAKIQKQNITDQHDANNNQLILSGNLNDAFTNIRSAESMLDSSKDLHVKGQDYAATRGYIYNSTANALYQSMFNHGNAKGALQLLQQEDNSDTADGVNEKINKAGVVNSGLDPKERGNWIEKFSRLKDSQDEVHVQDITQRYGDNVSAMYAGMSAKPDMKLVQDIQTAQNLTGERKQIMLSTLATAQTAGSAINQMQLASPDKAKLLRDQAIASVAPDANDTTNFQARQKAADMISNAYDNMVTAKATDGSKYVQDYFPEDRSIYQRAQSGDPVLTQQADKQLLARQSSVGVDNPRLMTVEDSKAMGAKIRGVDANTAATLITQLQQQHGRYFSNVMSEMVKDKSLPEGYGIVAFTPDQTDRQALISNIANQKSITEAFTLARPKAQNDLKDEMRKALSPYLNALHYSDPSGQNLTAVNGLVQNLTLGAKKDMTQNPDLLARDAAARQLDIMDRTFHPPISAANSTILLPRVVQGQTTNPQVIENFMQNHTYPQAFEDMKWNIPQDPMVAPDKQKERFYDTLMNTGRWVDNGNQTGIRFMYQDKVGSHFVHGADGKPVEYLFKDIPLMPARGLKDRKILLRQDPSGPVYMQ